MFQKQAPEMFYKKSDLKNFTKFTGVSSPIKFQVSGLQLKTSTPDFWENFKKTFCVKHHWIY